MELMGLTEVAKFVGVTRQAVTNWRTRTLYFPLPIAELASGPIWNREDIEKWVKTREGNMNNSDYSTEQSKINSLLAEYTKRKADLETQWQSKKRNRNLNEAFAIFVKCILSSRTKWIRVDTVVEELRQSGLLYSGSESTLIDPIRKIGGMVNYKNRAEWIVEDWEIFPIVYWLVDSVQKGTIHFGDKGLTAEQIFNKKDFQNWINDIQKSGLSHESLREVVKTLKGAGDKQASHFLFSLGIEGYAVIDTYILKKLLEFGVIKEKPKNITSNSYRSIEENMSRFALSIGIPLHVLDMLWWRQ
jgi:thermostable 8-oxoguanine DNA glycosylase